MANNRHIAQMDKELIFPAVESAVEVVAVVAVVAAAVAVVAAAGLLFRKSVRGCCNTTTRP